MAFAKTTAPQTTRRDLRVLIAEDNRINQIVIVEILHNAGMKTKVVSNGQEASEAVKNETFDVVLMDCQMPQMDGYEATARIRSWEQSQPNALRLPIIALTANATQGDAEKCLQAGMDAYCKKPINQKQVLALIDHWTSEK
jgi:CheY-like chemotaxis protein